MYYLQGRAKKQVHN